MVALGRRPDPDLEAATAALKAREAALRFLVGSGPEARRRTLNARLRRILDRDREAADYLRTEMDVLRERLAEHAADDERLPQLERVPERYREARSTGPRACRRAPPSKFGGNPSGGLRGRGLKLAGLEPIPRSACSASR